MPNVGVIQTCQSIVSYFQFSILMVAPHPSQSCPELLHDLDPDFPPPPSPPPEAHVHYPLRAEVHDTTAATDATITAATDALVEHDSDHEHEHVSVWRGFARRMSGGGRAKEVRRPSRPSIASASEAMMISF